MKAQNLIQKEHLEKAMSYEAYRQLIDGLLKEKKTTGPKQSQSLTEYTQLNVQRMKRLDKTVSIQPDLQALLQSLEKPWVWFVLTEGWCGDAAQNIPTLAKMAEYSENIDLKFVLRDEHLEIMDAYLTNGGRSIPKLICLDKESFQEIGIWGPRPVTVQDMVMAYRENPTEPYATFVNKIHQWYSKDKTQTLQQEFTTLIQQWKEA